MGTARNNLTTYVFGALGSNMYTRYKSREKPKWVSSPHQPLMTLAIIVPTRKLKIARNNNNKKSEKKKAVTNTQQHQPGYVQYGTER